MKLSLLYWPVPISKGKYNPLFLTYYAMLAGDANYHSYLKESKIDKNYIMTVLCWKFGAKSHSFDIDSLILRYLGRNDIKFEVKYDSSKMSMSTFISPSIMGAMRVMGPMRVTSSMGPMGPNGSYGSSKL